MKKILHLTISVGPTNSAYNELALPLKNKYNIIFYTYKKCNAILNEKIKLIQGKNSLFKNIVQLYKIIKKNDIDIIHAHNVHMIVISYISLLAIKKKHRPRLMCTIHTSYINYKLRNKMLFIISCYVSQDIIFCSNSSYNSIPEGVKKYIENKYSVIQNGIDIERIDNKIRNYNKYNSNLFCISFVGRIIDLKNPLLILDAFKRANINNSIIKFIGVGELEAKLKDKIVEYGLENKVIMKGMIERESVYDELFKSDLFISLSKIEGLPIAVMEAMYCECPIILSDIPAHREIGVNIEYINLDNEELAIENCAMNIRKYYDMQLKKRAELGKKNKQLIKDNFTINRTIQKYVEVYDRSGRE